VRPRRHGEEVRRQERSVATLCWISSGRPTWIELGWSASKTGLIVKCELDTKTYANGIKVSDAEMATLDITRNPFHPEWNYTITPRKTKLQN
jgi:hypothetical protein